MNTSLTTLSVPNKLSPEIEQNILTQPVSKIRWLHREQLKPNDYNPNHVAPLELKLLATSILEDGWTQPIVILPEDERVHQIVDGFHRWKISADIALYQRFGGYVPTAQLDIDAIHRMMSTVRHNRARGTHAITSMADIVRMILNSGADPQQVMKRLGMEIDEVERLSDAAGMPAKIGRKTSGYNPAWEVTEEGRATKKN